MAFDSPTITALASGQLVIRDYLTIFGWNEDDDPITFGYWTGPDDVSTPVVAATDGSTVTRDFIGGGTFLSVPPLVDTIGLEAGEYELGLSQIHDAVQDMVRGNRIRIAVVEMHRGLLSTSTWSLVSTPFPRLLGRVDEASINTPEMGGEGGTDVVVVADAVDLGLTSPALKSHATQQLRAGDSIRQYGDVEVDVWWGMVRGTSDTSPGPAAPQTGIT